MIGSKERSNAPIWGSRRDVGPADRLLKISTRPSQFPSRVPTKLDSYSDLVEDLTRPSNGRSPRVHHGLRAPSPSSSRCGSARSSIETPIEWASPRLWHVRFSGGLALGQGDFVGAHSGSSPQVLMANLHQLRRRRRYGLSHRRLVLRCQTRGRYAHRGRLSLRCSRPNVGGSGLPRKGPDRPHFDLMLAPGVAPGAFRALLSPLQKRRKPRICEAFVK